MSDPTQAAADRHQKRETTAIAIREFSVGLAQHSDVEPLLLVEAMVLATAMACIDLAQDGKRREAIVGAAEMLLQFSRTDAPWINQELKKDH